ncbi:MAG: hypothetical protein A3B68_05080 [Candidatus Melainabacteria bacterium RIFCSPHIGHO2_02_FULL_34_12]|nr:MAG: hypothetical protein A3B68_05080 [Candidatus Melainabacteria bacterium RIFCSPHIGHO2_02_FULL_34_12]
MPKESFASDQRYGESLLRKYEKKYLEPLVLKMPQWLKSYHLTLSSVIWSLLVILFSYFAREDIRWMWLVSFCILLQYFSDYFDGCLGRYRKEGLIKWGYYMDHFLDYVFLSSIFLGYLMLVDNFYKIHVFLLLVVLVGFMINSFLYFAISHKFKYSYMRIEPTEGRLLLIFLNSAIVIYSKKVLENSLIYFLVFFVIVLIYFIYKTQKEIWSLDIEESSR